MQVQEPTSSTEHLRQNEPAQETRPLRRRRFSIRGFASILLTFSFLALLVTGFILFVTPRGRTANWTDWSILGLGKHEWGALHISNSILFVVIAALHVFLNWSTLVRYIKSKAVAGVNMKKELALAGVLAAICVLGPIYDVAPFSSIMALNNDIKNYWDQQAERAPTPHAEELKLVDFATQVNLTVGELTSALAKEGFRADDASLTVGQVSAQKGVAPNMLLAAVQKHYPQAGGAGGCGAGWGRGRGLAQGRVNPVGGSCSDEYCSGDSCDGDDCDHTQVVSAGCSEESGDACQGNREGLGPGSGQGQGRGMGMGLGQGRGMGMGRGQGQGRGLGMGLGRGLGAGHGDGEGCQE